jgi:hypothetical protein
MSLSSISVFSLIKEKNELTQFFGNLQDGDAKRFIQSRLDQIDQILYKLGEYSNLLTFLFQNPKIQKISKTTIYDPKIALVYAPPQVGKTASMIQIITDCVARGVSVVVSSDNKKDQMAQMFSRLVRAVQSNTIFDSTFITTVDNKNFDSVVEKMSNFNSFVICCLDNKTQINKVYEKVSSIHENGKLSSLCLIHDEADTVTKARNISEVVTGQPESHKKWIELTQKICGKGIDMKRVFVTATPENVVYLHKPQFVWVLDIPQTYVSANDVQFSELTTFDNESVLRILTREAKLRREEGGIILYCVERNKETLEEEISQSQVFSNIVKMIKKTGLDVISIYNSDGIRVTFRLNKLLTQFTNKLEDLCVRYEENENDLLIKKNELSISRFYGLIQEVGAKVVLTIGRDLIARGISFVSDATENPLTATTMIYKPGTQLSQVAIAQAIGRLNGMAQPNLIRRLYTTDDVYTNYTIFNRNQKEIIAAIEENGLKVDTELIENIALWKASRTVDRKALKLEQDMIFWEDPASENEDEGYISDEGCIDGVKLSNLQKWINGDTLVGKMINFLYTCETPITVEDLKDGLEYTNSYKELASNIRSGSSLNAKYGKLWCHTTTNNTIILNSTIRTYIDNL